MEKITRLIHEHEKISLYLPESFEWLILNSGIVDDREVKEILAAPGESIESRQYFSWERFFTALLINKTDNTFLKYRKRTLNPAYLNAKVIDKILSAMEGIHFCR